MNHIVLFEPEKPANVGNIIRTCMALNAELIIIGPLTFELSDKSLRRAGMDYMVNFPIRRLATMEEFFSLYGDKDIYYITRYSKHLYTKPDYSDVTKDVFLMFGRESTGIPHDVLRDHYENTLRIPMSIDARSLNLSNCVALVLGEVLRQQNYYGLATTETLKGEDFLFEEK